VPHAGNYRIPAETATEGAAGTAVRAAGTAAAVADIAVDIVTAAGTAVRAAGIAAAVAYTVAEVLQPEAAARTGVVSAAGTAVPASQTAEAGMVPPGCTAAADLALAVAAQAVLAVRAYPRLMSRKRYRTSRHR